MRYLYGNYTNREPSYYTSSVIRKTLTNNNPCTQDYCIEFCKTESQLDDFSDDYDEANSDYVTLLPHLYNTNGSINKSVQSRIIPLKAIMDVAMDLHVHHILYDTTGRDVNDVRTWLDKAKGYEADVLLANSYASSREWEDAEDQLESLPEKYDLSDKLLDEHDRYSFILSLLEEAYEDERSLYTLKTPELEKIDSIRKISFSLAKRTASNILQLYGYINTITFQTPGEEIQERSSGKTELINGTYNGYLYVSPNPVKDILRINWDNIKGDKGEIHLYSLDGISILSLAVDISAGGQNIDVSELTEGVYAYQFITQVGFLSQGKFIKL